MLSETWLESDLLALIGAGELTAAPGLRRVLADVETRMRDASRSADPVIADAADTLRAAGGRRLRPLLTAVSAGFGDPHGDELVSAAAIVELVHVASLCHDDVIDRATHRRGVPTVSARSGNRVGVLVGDHLLAVAGELGAGLGSEYGRLLGRALQKMVTSQLAELGPAPRTAWLPHYLDVIEGKTAALVSLATEAGSIAGRVTPRIRGTLAACAIQFGMAYQIRDDILDVTADAGATGKTTGQDLLNGTRSLPILYALDGPSAARLSELLAQPGPGQVAEAREIVLATGLEPARLMLHRYADRARRLAATLPRIPPRDVLDRLISHLTESA